ncbi:trypsin-like serine peptidase [Bacteroides cellulosilyticus]|uniref:trypsin-like peptidase domain-containing protein n=1 Tax=Bacteroides cellulosilyticus TaxID=246787 RepID=UPI0032191D22
MKQYIYPILNRNYTDGSGLFIGNLFITAGHVIDEAQEPYIICNGASISLAKDNAILFYNHNTADGYDIAVYQIDGVESELYLSDRQPTVSMELVSASYKTTALGKELLVCNVTIREEIEGNYFYADTNVILTPGSSGSPIMKDNRVYGILCRGDKGTSLCAFLSSIAILKIL